MTRWSTTCARAAREKIPNFTALRGSTAATGLDSASVDALRVVNVYSFFDRPRDMVASMARALRPGGLLVVVDFPRGGGEGVNPVDVEKVTEEFGFFKLDESRAIPGHFALRFRHGSQYPRPRDVFDSPPAKRQRIGSVFWYASVTR